MEIAFAGLAASAVPAADAAVAVRAIV